MSLELFLVFYGPLVILILLFLGFLDTLRVKKREASKPADIIRFGILEHQNDIKTWLTPFDIKTRGEAMMEAHTAIIQDHGIDYCTIFRSVNGSMRPIATVGRPDPKVLEPKTDA